MQWGFFVPHSKRKKSNCIYSFMLTFLNFYTFLTIIVSGVVFWQVFPVCMIIELRAQSSCSLLWFFIEWQLGLFFKKLICFICKNLSSWPFDSNYGRSNRVNPTAKEKSIADYVEVPSYSEFYDLLHIIFGLNGIKACFTRLHPPGVCPQTCAKWLPYFSRPDHPGIQIMS